MRTACGWGQTHFARNLHGVVNTGRGGGCNLPMWAGPLGNYSVLRAGYSKLVETKILAFAPDLLDGRTRERTLSHIEKQKAIGDIIRRCLELLKN